MPHSDLILTSIVIFRGCCNLWWMVALRTIRGCALPFSLKRAQGLLQFLAKLILFCLKMVTTKKNHHNPHTKVKTKTPNKEINSNLPFICRAIKVIIICIITFLNILIYKYFRLVTFPLYNPLSITPTTPPSCSLHQGYPITPSFYKGCSGQAWTSDIAE